jgi:D-glycero-D-manno-heptose 1,7-bisphosphate phosphatase
MKADKICILINNKINTQDDNHNKLSVKNNFFIDNLLSKIIKYNFKKIYLLCTNKKKSFFNKYHKKKIHKSIIHCVDIGKQENLYQILLKLRTKINTNFIFLEGKRFIDINYFELIKSELGNNLAEICLIKKNIISSKKNIGLYLFNKKIFSFIKKNPYSNNDDIIQKLIDKDKILTKFYTGNAINNILSKKTNLLKKNNNILKNKALFLDRDGVINKHNGYVLKYKDFIFLSGVKKAIHYANTKGYLVIIITNQSAIGRSWMKESYLNKMHSLMKKNIFEYNGSYVDDILYSPYYHKSKKKIYRSNKKDRKPGTGMLIKAIKKWNINIKHSIFIGDQTTDKLAAQQCNIKFYYKMNYSLYKQIRSII